MPFSNDSMTLLLARRGELYRRLGRMDEKVAAAQKSPFFATGPGNSVTMRVSIEIHGATVESIDTRNSACLASILAVAGSPDRARR